jgi:biopolymer transport protein ExbD
MFHGGRSNQEEPLFINLTPMIDVILTLLIFFMTASKLYDWEEQKLDVAVPQVGSARPLTQLPDDVVLTVDATGAIAYNGDVMDAVELKKRLVTARENFPEQGVVIRADGRATHQKVADVMSACNAAGIGKIMFSVRETGGEVAAPPASK